ncbi:MAG: molybdopterin molybdotransferase MoeA, partial [Myxococcota bacterium]|nr:molybdopterin molybdotransferase MoeA [Myxococcota bacterium]
YSSNHLAISGMVREAGAVPVNCGIARDTIESTRAAFRRALSCDVVLSIGGVSVGDFDVVRQALVEEGADMRFWKVRIKPGKPLALGVIGGVPAFGLPGNPVSAMVSFLQFVRPVLRSSLGDPRPFLPVVDAVLDQPFTKSRGREELVRVVLRWDGGQFHANKTGRQGSARASSMVHAHGLALFPADSTGKEEGEQVAVQVFDMSFLDGTSAGYRWLP